ncbi:hypothetical protein pb186bvf_002260 [Paramecium bursaria]
MIKTSLYLRGMVSYIKIFYIYILYLELFVLYSVKESQENRQFHRSRRDHINQDYAVLRHQQIYYDSYYSFQIFSEVVYAKVMKNTDNQNNVNFYLLCIHQKTDTDAYLDDQQICEK